MILIVLTGPLNSKPTNKELQAVRQCLCFSNFMPILGERKKERKRANNFIKKKKKKKKEKKVKRKQAN